MPIHHLARLCTHLAISGTAAAARSSQQRQQQPTIVIQQNGQPVPPIPGEGYLPGYQPFTNQPSVLVAQPHPIVQPNNIKPDNYLALAILATIFCFFPFGIPAIIHASQVDASYESGDIYRAQSSSSAARGWCIASCIAGIICYSIAGMLVFFAVMSSSYDNDVVPAQTMKSESELIMWTAYRIHGQETMVNFSAWE